MFSQYTINDKWKKNMKYTLFRICLILLLSGCVSAAQPEDSSSLPESESSLSQAESESSSLPEISSQPEEPSLSSQRGTSSYGQVSESGYASGSLQSQADETISAADISAFEAKYYLLLGADAFDEQFYSENGEMLDWGKIDTSKVVQIYQLIYENPSDADEFDAFVAAYKQRGSISELIEPKDMYYANVNVTNRSYSLGTVVLEKENGRYIVGSYYLGDESDKFIFPKSKTLVSEICGLYDPAFTEIRLVAFPCIGHGILLYDGQQESVIFMGSGRDLGVEVNVLYSADQVMEKIIAARDSIVRPQHEPEVNSDGEINAVTG